MIMKNKYIFLLFLSVFGVFVFSPLEAVAKKKKKGKTEDMKMSKKRACVHSKKVV